MFISNIKDVPHIVYILIAFIFSLAVWLYRPDASFLPVLIALAGVLGGLSQKVQPRNDDANLNAENIENAEISVTTDTTDEKQ